MPAPTAAQQLERLAGDLHSVAFDFAEPAHTIQCVERRVAEVERIATAVRAVVRGGR